MASRSIPAALGHKTRESDFGKIDTISMRSSSSSAINSFLVWDASFLATVSSSQCLDMTGGKIENGLERGFVKHRLNYLLITDPKLDLRSPIVDHKNNHQIKCHFGVIFASGTICTIA